MRFSPENSVLTIIDVQGNLAEAMHDKHELFSNLVKLIQMAKILEIPIICTEQVPDKIGATVPTIQSQIPEIKPIIKTSFSCCGNPQFVEMIKATGRNEIIIAGIETHVCVIQTVRDLKEQGFQLQVVVDAVSSRTVNNKNYAICRMNEWNVELTSTEMLATELLRTSEHPKFREVLKLIR